MAERELTPKKRKFSVKDWDKNKEDGLTKISVFAELGKLMKGLRLVDREGVAVPDSTAGLGDDEQQTVEADDLNLSVSTKRFCGTCDLEFEDRSDQVVHFGCDWHRFNLKRKLKKGLAPVTREKFEEMADDLSSISGSDTSAPDSDSDADRSLDSSNPDVTSHRQPLVYFRNKAGDLLSMYRGLLVDKKNYDLDICTVAPRVGESRYWAILMVGGGHFAGAVFDKTELILHKTFHKYTVRAKRGTSQGMHDQKGSFARSAGASLRRYNEAQLVQNVQDLLTSWTEQLDQCSLVFLRAASYNKQIFFSNKNPPFQRQDGRIRMIPFPTRRPTMSEVKRVHVLLATITNYGPGQYLGKSPSRRQCQTDPPPEPKPKPKQKPKPKVLSQRQGLPYSSSDSESESEGEIEWVMREEVISTGHLADFAIEIDDEKQNQYRRKPQRRKKKAKAKVERAVEEEVLVEVAIQESLVDTKLRDDVFTACKTGNLAHLNNVIADFLRNHDNQRKADGRHGNADDDDENIVDNLSNQDTAKDVDFDDLPVVEESVLFGEGCQLTSEDGKQAERLPDEVLKLRFGGKGETMLHVAARAEKEEMTYYLLTAGVDPSIKDGVGMVPYAVCKSKAVRNVYRRFMAECPDKYDYTLAQVPAPLTEDMENERKMREIERKKLNKKAKRERQKVQKEKDAVIEAENREKDRFLKLSDREKRALAAERRLVDQVATSGGDKPVLSRCWQCGDDMTGKVPFEYYDYTFCSTKCLKLHRTQNAQTR